jgi:uncharacterized damage-inducible protein DinB
MELLDYLRRQFAYNAWANREVLRAIGAAHNNQRSLQLMAHVFAAERVWVERLLQLPQSVPVWPTFTVDACEREGTEVVRLWREYLGQLDSAKLIVPVTYKNSKGESWTNNVLDILSHVLLHSAYHRGQIASHMRESGMTPAYTDFIHAVRQNLTE